MYAVVEIQGSQFKVSKNQKLYVNKEEGFIGTSLRKDEYICDCSDIDDIITFTQEGYMKIVKVDTKVFIGKQIVHAAVFKKNDTRTIYNMIYRDGKKAVSYTHLTLPTNREE